MYVFSMLRTLYIFRGVWTKVVINNIAYIDLVFLCVRQGLDAIALNSSSGKLSSLHVPGKVPSSSPAGRYLRTPIQYKLNSGVTINILDDDDFIQSSDTK